MSKTLEEIPIQYIKGVGPAKAKLFSKLGIESIEDLLYFFPRRYDDRRKLTPINKLIVGEWFSIAGVVLVRGSRRSWYTRKHVCEIAVDDGTGQIRCIWFNQPYLEGYFKPQTKIVLYGKVEVYKEHIQMVSPEYEIIENEDQTLSMGRIVPVYSLTKGMSQRYLRKMVKFCVDQYKEQLKDVLPVSLRNLHRLANVKRSIQNLHFPEDFKDQEDAFRRVAFEEFFLFQISVIQRRMSIIQKQGVRHKVDATLIAQYQNIFPFELTFAQKRVMEEIFQDMQKETPMLRLLQGDVGSGKTIVALGGAVVSFQNGFQSVIMAPTEILARQHYNNVLKITENPFLAKMRVGLLVSSLAKKEKEQMEEKIKKGDIDIVIGTHALISEHIEYKNLSYVVVDEQHKFGVRQRALLSQKGINPDVLIMTATPIPRTLSMTLYGDLDLSVIDEMPKERGKITTQLFTPDQDKEVYKIVSEKVKGGAQAYIIYPIIEESEKLDLKAAEVMFNHLKKKDFKDFRLGIIHGQMKQEQANEIMEKFKNHEVDILVATTVLEVGVDVPNANVMVVEHAERFGLAQLHQLRGRVGRGQDDALCLLIGDPTTEDANLRLEAICASTDGFKIAEQDLMIRGPGHFLGRHQHGLNELKIANPVTQMDILQLARKEALALSQEDPSLTKSKNALIKETIQKRYPAYLSMAQAG